MKQTIQHAPSCADDSEQGIISVSEAHQRIYQALEQIKGKEKLALRSALNRVLAKDIHSPLSVPAQNNSAMDGYALSGDDLPESGIQLYEVIGTAYAGKIFEGVCKKGQVIRIMTGAVIPKGCDTVVIQEQVESLSDSQINIGVGHKTGQNVRLAGEDIMQGSVVLRVGRCISAADLGVIASLGISEVSVYRRPRVAFFSTGDELCSVGETLAAGQIYDSNRYTLYGMLKRLNVEILDMGVVADNQQAMEEAFISASEIADLIISSGGVSVGDADYIKPTLKKLGDIDFWKISMKPGRPLTFGKVNNSFFFGLPGNPVAVMVTFSQFVAPALYYLASGQQKQRISLKAISTSKLRKRPGRIEFQRGIYHQNEQGELMVRKTGKQGSGILTSMSEANCFIVLSEESTGVESGQLVDIQPFESFV